MSEVYETVLPSAPVLTRSEEALKVAMIALSYIADRHGLDPPRTCDQAREAVAKITDILGGPMQIPTAEREIEVLREQVAELIRQRDRAITERDAYREANKLLRDEEERRQRDSTVIRSLREARDKAESDARVLREQNENQRGTIRGLRADLEKAAGAGLDCEDDVKLLRATVDIFRQCEQLKGVMIRDVRRKVRKERKKRDKKNETD
jgi:hypothetical protein